MKVRSVRAAHALQPERHGAADKVNLVAGPRHFQPQFGGDHAGAARAGVAQHGDFQLGRVRLASGREKNVVGISIDMEADYTRECSGQ